MQPLCQPSPRECIGVIADTHGLLRPEALEALKGDTVSCTRAT